MENSSFHILLDRYLTGDLTPSEKVELASMLDIPENQAVLEQFVESIMVSGKYAEEFDSDSNIKERLFASFNDSNLISGTSSRPVPRIHFLKTGWFKYAAAILITICAGAYLWNNLQTDKDLVTANGGKQLQTDIPPGGEKAVLTLADGTKIVLDNAANGNLAQQGSTQVVKLTNGQIAYNVKGLSDKDIMWNTMSTPTGGQYQVMLPDGTRVWLNAASSITYPAAFTSKNRLVKITGEVYFEVSKNKEKPFVVDINGKSTVHVLGTSFNINSYANEASTKTTLIEGSVKISSLILKPGQQAVVSFDQQPQVITADLDQILAWKNGLFNFNGLDLPVVMRQLERWYDIKVKYEGQVPSLIFRGEMYRNANLSDALDIFQKLGVKFRMEGKTLIVSG